MKTTPSKKVKKKEGYVILNYVGDLWSQKVFDSESEARRYMELFQDGYSGGINLSRHTIVQAVQTITYTLPKIKS